MTETTDNVAEEAAKQPGVETFVTAASKDKDARKITLTYNFGKDLDEMVAIHGKEVIYGMAIKALKVAMQANIRTRLDAVKEGTSDLLYSDGDIDNFIQTEYKPGVRQARAAGVGGGKALETIAAKLASGELTMDKLVAMIQEAQAKQAAKATEAPVA
jgi:hypothetical protein